VSITVYLACLLFKTKKLYTPAQTILHTMFHSIWKADTKPLLITRWYFSCLKIFKINSLLFISKWFLGWILIFCCHSTNSQLLWHYIGFISLLLRRFSWSLNSYYNYYTIYAKFYSLYFMFRTISRNICFPYIFM
jgi:hypothetical protein